MAVLHRNVKGTIGQFTNTFGSANINIDNMTNKSKDDYAYTLLDIDAPVTDDVIGKLNAVDGVLKVRVIK